MGNIITGYISIAKALLAFMFFCSTAMCRGSEWLAVTEEFPPYNYIEEGKAEGYATEIVRALGNELGYHIPIKVLPWSRAMLIASSRPNVIIFSMMRTLPREDKYHWIGEINRMELYTWQLRDNPSLLYKPQENVRFGVIRALDDNVTRLLIDTFLTTKQNIIEVDKAEQLTGMLLKHRVDKILIAENAWIKLKREQPEEITLQMERDRLISSRSLYIASSLQTELAEVAKLQDAYRQIINSSDMLQARHRYLSGY